MKSRLAILVGLALAIAAACGGASSTGSPGPGPTSSPAPTGGPVLTIPQVKLALVDTYGPLWYCDPDFYPIQRQDEMDAARERWAEVMADAEAFKALTSRLGLDPSGPFTDEARLSLYQAWKVLNAIALDPIGNDTYRFDYLAQPPNRAAEGTRTAGTISATGKIAIGQQSAAGEPMCPICLARGSAIDTPSGPAIVESLRIGDAVWTLDAKGSRVRGTVIGFGSTAAPAGHHVVRLVLGDGRSVTASPGHPLADGRLLGDLRVGDGVDGSTVVSAGLDAYQGARTYDIVASGPTGTYFVDGIALGTTLAP